MQANNLSLQQRKRPASQAVLGRIPPLHSTGVRQQLVPGQTVSVPKMCAQSPAKGQQKEQGPAAPLSLDIPQPALWLVPVYMTVLCTDGVEETASRGPFQLQLFYASIVVKF